jgi:hypothetical protein
MPVALPLQRQGDRLVPPHGVGVEPVADWGDIEFRYSQTPGLGRPINDAGTSSAILVAGPSLTFLELP